MKPLAIGVWLCSVVAVASALPQSAKAGAPAAAEQAVLGADKALVDAIGKPDKAAAAALLDDAFTWTDRNGKTRGKAEVVQALAPSAGSDSDVSARVYGQIAVVTLTHRIAAQNVDVRVLRVWIKRTAGWRAIVHQGNAILPAAATPAPPDPPAPGGCDNPCKTLPYEPKSAAERDILAAYRALETAVATHNADDWATHFADEFVVVGRDGRGTTKLQRIAAIRKQKETNATTNPGPLRSMRIWVDGDAAVMTSNHVTSTVKATPYRVTRVWVKRDGRWQMACSQQTTVAPTAGATKQR